MSALVQRTPILGGSRSAANDGEVALGEFARFLEERTGAWHHLPPLVRAQLRGGKRLRDRLLFAIAPATTPAAREFQIRAAAAVELVHAGSLLHDDVVDHAERRRGHCTAHRIYGERFATRAGTLVMTEATLLFAGLPAAARAAFARAARAASHGQLAEIARTADPGLGVRERLQIMDGKTAVIFTLAATLGALLGEATPAVVRASAATGRWFGMLFQLADDVEDLCAPPAALGRAPGSDLRGGIVTLPVVFLVEALGPAGFEAACALARQAEDPAAARRLCALFERAGAFERTRALARRWFGRIEHMLGALPPGPGRRWILDLARQVEQAMVERLERING